jgi:hypothetical protein
MTSRPFRLPVPTQLKPKPGAKPPPLKPRPAGKHTKAIYDLYAAWLAAGPQWVR